MRRPRGSRRLAGWLLAAALAGCTSDAPGPLRVVNETGPAPVGARLPNFAASAGGEIRLTWVEPVTGGNVLKWSAHHGAGWTEPATISAGDDWFVNWADFPEMAALGNGALYAHWLARTGTDTYAYGVRAAISTDAGGSWSRPVNPHDDTPTEHGFVTWIPEGDAAGLVWLDGRYTGGGHDHDAGHGAGAMTLRYARMSPDGSLSDAAEIDARVCDCCTTDAVRLADGTLLVVYRDRSDDEVRDIGIASKPPGGAWEHRVLHDDGWKIEGCPVNGPEIDAAGDRVAAAWFTAGSDDRGRVLVAFSKDGGESFSEPLPVDDGSPIGRVDVVIDGDGAALVSWLENAPEGLATVRVRRVPGPGRRGEAVTVATTSAERSSGFPRMARGADAVWVAWTDPREEHDGIHVATVRRD